ARPLGVILLVAGILSAQAQPPSDVLKTIDQLIEQNRKLEQQNRELMEQITSLRQTLANQQQSSPPGTVSAKELAKEAVAEAPKQEEAKDDDRTLLPRASDGNPVIFGEFNPGRGFTVAKGEYGELNLSGYMATRYLNQLPSDQTATDHLGRP